MSVAKANTASSTRTFFRNLRRAPRNTGAFFPSGPFLAKAMATLLGQISDEGLILELGPGTGVFTKALLERGIAPERIVLIEFNPDFVRFLRKNYPGVTVLHGSAFDLKKIWAEKGYGAIAGIISGLPLLNFPVADGSQLITDAISLLQPNGKYVQFTYSQRPSIPAPSGISVSLGKRVWLNAPPASVWVYTRQSKV